MDVYRNNKWYTGSFFMALVLITICFQLTEVKLFNIKISEILLLLLLFFFAKTLVVVNKKIFYFFIFFTSLFVKTLIQNFFTRFYINTDLPFLKLPGFISFARLLELICCLFFTHIVIQLFSNYEDDKLLNSIYKILRFQIYPMGALFGIFFLIYYFRILKFHDLQGFLVYDTTGRYADTTLRLRGFYVEGGPFGLFYAFIYVLYDWVLTQLNRKDHIGRFIILLIILLASSKAGISMMTVYFSFQLYRYLNASKYRSVLKLVGIPLISVGVILLIINLLYSYVSRIGSDLNYTADSMDGDIDAAIVMGRVSGLTIVPNMIQHNFLLGIGLGNYPLLRNNPAYLGFFPEIRTEYWDSSGLGGLIDLLVDGGFLFFAVFCILFYKIYHEIRKDKSILILFFAFIAPFIFGVQLFFIYPWFSLALIILLIKRKQNSIINT